MYRTTLSCLLAFVALPAAPTAACLWDNDTLLDERRGLPGVAEILAGKWERHSPLFYEHRLRTTLAHLDKYPNELAAYDNAAVALEKLGRADEAIALILKKDKIKPGEYTTHANLGTFYLHTGDFEKGTAHIRKAIEINPNAHFGREKYQLMAAEFLREAKRDPALFDRGSFIFPELIASLDRSPKERTPTYAEYLQYLGNSRRLSPEATAEKTAGPIEGVVGMIRFGTGTSPHLFHALGDLLAARGDRHLAVRTYLRAIQYDHPRPQLLKEAIESVQTAIEHPEELSDAVIEKERAAADAWVNAYQQFEDDLIRQGKPPTTEADYAAFYAQNGSARPPPSSGDAMGDVMRKFFRTAPVLFALCALLVLFGLGKLAWVLTRRRRRTVAGHATIP